MKTLTPEMLIVLKNCARELKACGAYRITHHSYSFYASLVHSIELADGTKFYLETI